MVRTIPTLQAARQLVELIRNLGPDDEIALTDDGQLVARILPEIRPTSARRPGACTGMLEILQDGDEEVLDHFKDYLP